MFSFYIKCIFCLTLAIVYVSELDVIPLVNVEGNKLCIRNWQRHNLNGDSKVWPKTLFPVARDFNGIDRLLIHYRIWRKSTGSICRFSITQYTMILHRLKLNFYQFFLGWGALMLNVMCFCELQRKKQTLEMSRLWLTVVKLVDNNDVKSRLFICDTITTCAHKTI